MSNIIKILLYILIFLCIISTGLHIINFITIVKANNIITSIISCIPEFLYILFNVCIISVICVIRKKII